ncbi:hypothetical protein ACFWUP_17850 [Nocardia sp. NPDC058658]|uniref:hypothetical protein n=1 Tax=Nocardia sp. NPDC058658 TaxID=3346580 RepID=UPI00365FC3F7
MSDKIDIAPDQVITSGGLLTTEADEATAALAPMFDSAEPAQNGNPGFETGAKLVALASLLKTELTDSITDLATAGQNIVTAANQLQNMDAGNATGISRIATALNGLGRPSES